MLPTCPPKLVIMNCLSDPSSSSNPTGDSFSLPPACLHSFESYWVLTNHQSQHQALKIQRWIITALPSVHSQSLLSGEATLYRKEVGGPHSPASRAHCCSLGHAPQCITWKSTVPTEEASEVGSSVLAIPGMHPEHSTLSRLLSSFSTSRCSISDQFSPLPGSSLFPTLHHDQSLRAYLQPLRQYMPRQLLSAFPKFNLSFKAYLNIQHHPFQQSQSLRLKQQ